MRRNRPAARRSGPPPRPAPRNLCIGGPLDGRVVSALDLPLGGSIGLGAAGVTRVRYDEYVLEVRGGQTVFVWHETKQ